MKVKELREVTQQGEGKEGHYGWKTESGGYVLQDDSGDALSSPPDHVNNVALLLKGSET